jgi:hypothetical protein
MAAGVGQKIEATDYNSIQNKIAGILGTGSGTSGYGQPVSSSAVVVGDKINLSGWLNLRADLRAAREHQLGTGAVGTGSATDGANLLVPATSLVISEALRNQYDLFADTVVANKWLLGTPGQYSTETVITFSKSGAWNSTISNVVTISGNSTNAGTAENMRFFFNAGGSFQLQARRNGPSAGAKDDAWTTMLSQAATVTMDHATTSYSGSNGTAYNIGYDSLTTSDQVIFWKPAPAGNYAENDYYIYARKSANGADVIFTLQFRDDDTGDQTGLGPPVDENVNAAGGTLDTTVSMIRPSGTNVSILAPTSSQTGM